MSVAASGSGPVIEPVRHVCDVCSRHFKRPEHLKRHERVHVVDESLPTCQHCGKRFSRRLDLLAHRGEP